MVSCNSKSINGYLCIIGGFITLMSTGAVQYTFGNIVPYLGSYLASKHDNTPENYNYYIDRGAWIYVARGIFFVFGTFIGSKLVDLFKNGKTAIFIGDIILSGSVMMTYFTCSSLIGMILTYGCLSGIGIGISYVIPVSIAIKWFPNNEALISGIILSGYGLSALIFNIVISAIINPYNIQLDTETGFLYQYNVLNNVPSSFWKMSLIYFAMQIIGLLLIQEAPNEYINIDNNNKSDSNSSCLQMKEIKHVQTENENENEKIHLLTKKSVSISEKYDLFILKDPKFLNLWFTLFFSEMTNIMYSTQWKTFTNQQLNIVNDYVLSLMGSLSAITNATGRIFWGIIQDKTTHIFTVGIMTASDCLLLSTWSFIGDIFYKKTVLIIFANIWFAGIVFCQIAIYSICIQRIAKIYGIDKVNYYYALLMTNHIPSGIFSALVVTEIRVTFGWIAMSLIMAASQFITFCIVMSTKRCN